MTHYTIQKLSKFRRLLIPDALSGPGETGLCYIPFGQMKIFSKQFCDFLP